MSMVTTTSLLLAMDVANIDGVAVDGQDVGRWEGRKVLGLVGVIVGRKEVEGLLVGPREEIIEGDKEGLIDGVREREETNVDCLVGFLVIRSDEGERV